MSTVVRKENLERLAYSVSEAAAVIGVSTWTVRRAIEAGRIPCVRFGQRIVVPRHALARAMDILAEEAS